MCRFEQSDVTQTFCNKAKKGKKLTAAKQDETVLHGTISHSKANDHDDSKRTFLHMYTH